MCVLRKDKYGVVSRLDDCSYYIVCKNSDDKFEFRSVPFKDVDLENFIKERTGTYESIMLPGLLINGNMGGKCYFPNPTSYSFSRVQTNFKNFVDLTNCDSVIREKFGSEFLEKYSECIRIYAAYKSMKKILASEDVCKIFGSTTEFMRKIMETNSICADTDFIIKFMQSSLNTDYTETQLEYFSYNKYT